MLPPSSTPTTTHFYRPELDWLRFFAAFIVFTEHCFGVQMDSAQLEGLSPYAARWVVAISNAGGMGVPLFFLLSAYLITEILRQEHERTGTIRIGSFLVRRILRIWPLYFFYLSLAIFAFPVWWPGDSLGRHSISFLLFAGNWACSWWNYPPSIAAHLWSVGIEEQFYLAFPLLIWLCGFRRVPAIALCALGASWIARELLEHAPSPILWMNTFSWCEPIACGALIAILLKNNPPRIASSLRVVLALGGLAAYCYSLHLGWFDGPHSPITLRLATIGSIALFFAFLGAKGAVPLGRTGRMFAFLGRISFGIYVYHPLAIRLTSGAEVSLVVKGVLAFVLTVLLATLSFVVIERPALRLKRKFSAIDSSPRE